MIFRMFKWYGTGKTIYQRVLKPIYEELRKDAYAADAPEEKKIKITRKKKTNVVNQKSKRSHKRQADTQ